MARTSDFQQVLSENNIWTGTNTFNEGILIAATKAINFGSGDVTITHSTNTLAFAGATSGYTFDENITIADDKLLQSGANTSTNFIDLNNGGGNVLLNAAGSLTIRSNSSVVFDMDYNNDQADRVFTWRTDAAATTLMTLNELGNFYLYKGNEFSVGSSNTAGNVGIEIGNSGSSGGVAYIDLHFGNSSSEDYNVRIQNNASGKLNLVPQTSSGSILDIDFANIEVGGTIEMGTAKTIYRTGDTDCYFTPGFNTSDIGQSSTGDMYFGIDAGNGSTTELFLWYTNGFANQLMSLSEAGLLQLNGSATGSATLNIPHGTAPSSPVNGDIWTTTAGIYVRINGSTVGPLS